MVTVRFFAMLKGLAKTEVKEYEVASPITVGELRSMIRNDFPALAGLIESRSLLVSVNQDIAGNDDTVRDGDEVGFLPPFSGG